ncbi:MAG: glycosyltransferase family 4 protein [Burkholderiales bacterium]|nr:glycosyltransferase family 4 protein [Burkholderiales bacterium]
MPPLRAIAAALYRIALVGARTVFFQNADNRREFERLGIVGSRHRVVTVAGSGVDLERYAPAPFPPEPSFLMLARLLVEKGVREYVAACREVRRHRPQARCRLAGWIDDNPTAIRREELAQWQREGDVEYLGYLDDVRPAIAASAVYVLPSYHEGMPRSVLEAMAMGRPIITTDAPGCRETVEDGVNGYRVPVRDSTALAQAMMRYAEAPELIAGTRGGEPPTR